MPNSAQKRLVATLAMFFFTLCHLSLKLLGIAVLSLVHPLYVAVFLGGDLLFYLLLKLARNDLRYWMNIEGPMSWVVSIVFRAFTKLFVDFTVMVQLRRK